MLPLVLLAALALFAIVGADSVGGTVVDATGKAVAGARVALIPTGLFDPSGATYRRVESDANGRFQFTAVANGRYAVTAVARDGAGGWVANSSPGDSDLRLALSAAGRRLSGVVRDRVGTPRAGAEVRLSHGLGERGDVFVTTSAADGRFIAIVPHGEYAVSAVHDATAAAPRAFPAGRDAIDLVLDPVAPPGPTPRAVREWVRSHTTPLVATPGAPLPNDLAAIRALVGDARVVGVGEATHGTREIFQLKHRLFELLVRDHGFNVFAIEIGLPEGFALDDYVLTGRGDPERMLAGQFVAVWQSDELLDLVRWMRAWNETHTRKLRFYGLDIRAGIRAARETFAYLARVDRDALSTPNVRALLPLADPVDYQAVLLRPKAELGALAGSADALVAQLTTNRSAYVTRSDAETFWRVELLARALVKLLTSRAAVDEAGRVRERDGAMADNVLRILEHEGPQARIFVWGHNAHIAGDADAEPRMMGVNLRARLGQSYRAIGSAIHRGAYQTMDATRRMREFAIAPAPPGSVEDSLATTGLPSGLLSLQALPAHGDVADWFHTFQILRQYDGLYDDPRAGWGEARTLPARDYDAFLFVTAGTAARRVPVAREMDAERREVANELRDLGFEAGGEGAAPAWSWARARQSVCGYALSLDREQPFEGRVAARIARTEEPRYGECAAELQQRVDATRYRGQRLRLRGAVQVARGDEHAHLQLVVTNARGTPLQRTEARASGSAWRTYDLTVDVPDDAAVLEIGLAFDGDGSAHLDAVSLSTEARSLGANLAPPERR